MMKLTKWASLTALLFLLSCGTDVQRTLSDSGNIIDGGATAAPTFDPGSSIVDGPITVTVSSATPEAQIYCTTDGSDPTQDSTLYSEPLTLSETTTLRCRAYHSGLQPSLISQAVYTINTPVPPAGTPTPTPTPTATPTVTPTPTPTPLPPTPTPTEFVTAHVEMSFQIDDVETLRIQDGVMTLIHGSGSRAENPWVKVTRPDGSVSTIYPWVLDPFFIEGGITCNWSGNFCVSSPLNLSLPGIVPGGRHVISPSSLHVFTGRGSVQTSGTNEIVLRDPATSQSVYWFQFDYVYEKSLP